MRPRTPFVTLALVAANLAVYLLELAPGGQGACDAYGLVPARFVHEGGLAPLVSSLFLHDPATLVHLGGNMVFLAVFGAHIGGFVAGFLVVALMRTAGSKALETT